LLLSFTNDITMSSVKMNESIEIPFGGQSRMGQRNHILDGGLDPAWDRALRLHAELLKSIGRFSGA